MPLSPYELRRLRTMGVSWYVSRLYGNFIDQNHDNWRMAGTQLARLNAYRNTYDHVRYLKHIIEGNSNRYNANAIGLTGVQIVEMATELLKVIH